MSGLRGALFLAGKDLAYSFRHRETVVWTFLMPIIFFYFIGTVTGGSGRGGLGGAEEVALLAPADAGFLVDELERRLVEQGLSVTRVASAAELAEHPRRITVPEPADGRSFTEAVLAGERVELGFERSGRSLAAAYDRFRIRRALYTVVADLAVLRREGAEVGPDDFARLAARPRALALRVETAGARRDPPVGFAQAVPGTLIMFTMLVLLTSGSIVLVVEREQGLLRRLAATPIPRGAVVAGKWGARMVLGAIQIGFAMLAGTLLFGVDWGGALPGLIAVLAGWAAFNASLGMALANLVRSPPQMAGIGVVVTMVMAALGGCWWPIEIAPRWMQTLALFLPSGWAMDAMHRLVSFGYGAGAALPHAAALAAAAAGLGWIAARTFRYE